MFKVGAKRRRTKEQIALDEAEAKAQEAENQETLRKAEEYKRRASEAEARLQHNNGAGEFIAQLCREGKAVFAGGKCFIRGLDPEFEAAMQQHQEQSDAMHSAHAQEVEEEENPGYE